MGNAFRFVIGGLLGLAIAPTTAEANITSVTVDSKRPYEGAPHYTYAELTIHGTVARADGSVGEYTVPAISIYPDTGPGHHDDPCEDDGPCGRVGIVDWINGAYYFRYYPGVTEDGLYQFTLRTTGSYLFNRGYTYLSVNWNIGVFKIFGPTPPADGQPHNHMVYGSIEHGADAYEILRDAARLMKSPYAGGPAAVNKVFSFGFSQTASLQVQALTTNFDPTNIYDGHVIGMFGYRCYIPDDVGPLYGTVQACAAPLPTSNHGKVVTLVSESDMTLANGFNLRNSADPNWRQYEMAGIAHLTKPVLDFSTLPYFTWTDPEQSISDPRPMYRAAIRNLTLWSCRGITPPPAKYFDGALNSAGAFVPVTDADGNWSGGVRLPHVGSTVANKPAGAPLGVYTGVNPRGQVPFNAFLLLGGIFTRFSDAELLSRYPTRKGYVELVTRSAAANVLQRYITVVDGAALILQAKVEPLPAGTRRITDVLDGDVPEADVTEAGCSTTGGAGAVPVVAIAMLMFVRRRRRA